MQLQADQIQRPVERPVVAETTALGAAFLAGLATGVWSSREELAATWRLDRRFTPERTRRRRSRPLAQRGGANESLGSLIRGGDRDQQVHAVALTPEI